MKTTLDLPDQLLISAKKTAAERRKTLRALVEQGLRLVIGRTDATRKRAQRSIHWVAVPGGLPPALDVRNREEMNDFVKRKL